MPTRNTGSEVSPPQNKSLTCSDMPHALLASLCFFLLCFKYLVPLSLCTFVLYLSLSRSLFLPRCARSFTFFFWAPADLMTGLHPAVMTEEHPCVWNHPRGSSSFNFVPSLSLRAVAAAARPPPSSASACSETSQVFRQRSSRRLRPRL